MKDISQKLEKLILNAPCWAEVRYHKRKSQSIGVQKGLVKQLKSSVTSGVGIRVLVNGTWGFSSTSDLSETALEKTLKQAINCAKNLSALKKKNVQKLDTSGLKKGEFILSGYKELEQMPFQQKLEQVIKAENQVRASSSTLETASCAYNEIFEDKVVVTTDGALALSQLARNEIKLSAVASQKGDKAEGHMTSGKTGNWQCLFQENSFDSLTQNTAKLAIDLLKAPSIPGGLSTIILSPAMVGILSHEAIGHTVEADFVLSGSVAAGKIGQKVASPLVTMCDSGVVENSHHGGGDLLVDDEGIETQNTIIINKGMLESYLHNRETATFFNVKPTGSARAWLYHNEPLIRMRNTYIMPGSQSLEEIIESTQDGYLIDCPLGGQADSTGEFMFGAQKVSKIENGKITKMFRGATISGQAFEVLSTVDAVSKEFKLDLGAGYCGKGQPAKVDAGGPYLRCKAIIGGVL